MEGNVCDGVLQEEAERLRSILVRFPTGEDQDAALLASGELTDWRERVIVKFRMLRKRALRLTMQVHLILGPPCMTRHPGYLQAIQCR